jgi:hypothetical protein
MPHRSVQRIGYFLGLNLTSVVLLYLYPMIV